MDTAGVLFVMDDVHDVLEALELISDGLDCAHMLAHIINHYYAHMLAPNQACQR